jgi:primary-amine oxidase
MSAALRVLLCTLLGLLGCARLASPARPGATPRGTAHVAAPAHPLDPLSPSELRVSFTTVQAHFAADPALPKQALRFPMVVLAEPDKQLVRSFVAGQPFARHAEVQVFHYPSNRLWLAEVDLRGGRVTALALQPAGVQPALTTQEFIAGDQLVRAYAPWQAALRARGVDPRLAYLDGWAPGDTTLPAEVTAKLPLGEHTRLLRYLTFYRGAPRPGSAHEAPHNPYDRPIEGVLVTVDLNAMQVVHMSDTGAQPLSIESGNTTPRRTLRPLHVQQPEGSDIHVRGHEVRWQGFVFHVVMHPREGLVLYDVRHEDNGALRPIAYRLSLSEIYVPYGLGEASWAWRGAFDLGEYNAGKAAQSIDKGRDVPDNALLLDATLFDDAGPVAGNETGSQHLPRSIALYERDAGFLWTRTDPSSGARDTRPARELVVTWSCWIGNYIYGFDWIFKLDGSIEVKAQLSGTTLNRGTDARPEASAPKVGKDARGVLVSAPNHQHFLNFRLDLDVDGSANTVMEMEAQHLPGTPYKNAFDATMVHLEAEGPRDVDPFRARHWHVESASQKNPFDKPTSYALEPGGIAVPYAAPDFAGLTRAEFARHQLWVTRYQPDERYAAGAFPNQGRAPDGVGRYSEPAEPVHGQDVVLWYTMGFTHLAKPEDHPVMATESVGFRLTPRGFFAHNPALDVAYPGAPVPGSAKTPAH